MRKYNQSGGIALFLSDILLVIALVAAIGFGVWAFNERTHYKNDSDAIVKAAVAKAERAQKIRLDQDFAKRSKSPYKAFKGPATYGSISFSYPKTWSGYVDQSSGSQLINGYFHPGVVPSINQSGNTPTAFALRVELLSTDYTQQVKQLDSQVSAGSVTASAYIPPKMKDVANVQPGVLFKGAISQDLNGSMLVIKVRDKTLQVSTQSNKFLGDFNDTVLRTLTFAP